MGGLHIRGNERNHCGFAARGRVLRPDGPRAVRSYVLTVTVLWFIIWLIANNIGGNEPLLLDPVNAWVGTLILAVGLDLGAAHARGSRA